MKISDEEIEHRLQLGEDSNWEFKQVEFCGDCPAVPQQKNWMNEIIAFANAHGGTILFGVTGDGKIQSMSQLQLKNLNKILAEKFNDVINPAIRIDTLNHMLADGKRLLRVDVPEGESVHHGPDGAYMRVGSSKRKMTSEEVLLLAQKREQARFRWVDEQLVLGPDLQALDENLWKPLLSSEDVSNPEIGLEKIRMLAQDEHGVMRATVAGILICSKTPTEWLRSACIRATHYRGNDQASGQLDANIFEGPVNSQIVEALSFVRRNMQVTAHKEPNRIDMPRYSVNAVFEAIVNAVAHRDYSIKGSSIRLLMFENRLEIYSPGALPGNLTIEGMPQGQLTRNEALVSVLGRMRIGNVSDVESRQFFIGQRGVGVRIILRETQELSGKLPEYLLVDDSELCLVIPAASVETSQASPAATQSHVMSGICKDTAYHGWTLSLGLAHASEAAAIAAAELVGRGTETDADQTAVYAMREELNRLNIQGRVVIGEGERDKAPMLYVGENVGTGKNGEEVDIALDPLEGTTLCAKAMPNALSVIAMGPRGSLLHAPDVYMNKIAVGPDIPAGTIDLDATPAENVHTLAKARGVAASQITVCILERPRHVEIIESVRATGAAIRLITDGDVAGVMHTSQAAETGIDMYLGIGGAPEGVLAAAALRCMGGQFQGRLMFYNDDEVARAHAAGITDLDHKYDLADLVQSDVLFAATGVTDGSMLRGVRRVGAVVHTDTLLLNSHTRSVRRIRSQVRKPVDG